MPSTKSRPGRRQCRLGLDRLEDRRLFAAGISIGTPTAAPPTPVYSMTYDLTQISQLFPNPVADANAPEHGWTISFDRTTQTIWVALRGGNIGPEPNGGNRIIQFDPATGTARVYNLQNLPNVDLQSDPHGVFFDFDTHLTPRVWFTQRPNNIPAGMAGAPQSLGYKGQGEVSYIDLATGQLVVYNLAQQLRDMGYQNLVGDLHAISIDRNGTAWVSDPDDGLMLQLDTSRNPNGTTTGSLNSDSGELIVHRVPKDILGVTLSNTGNENAETGPHGIDTVVGADGQQYVYVSDLGAGRFILLRPSLTPGGPDQWTTWDMSKTLNPGGLGPSAVATAGQPQFPTVDNAETPDNPLDDHVYFGDPGSTVPNNVIRSLDVGAFLANPSQSTTPIQSWIVPNTPGSPSTAYARPNQVFVDRTGSVYYIDRQNGIGRLDPTTLAPANGVQSTVVDAAVISAVGQPATYSLTPDSRLNLPAPIPITLTSHVLQSPANTQSVSTEAGLDQWTLKGSGSTGQLYGGGFTGPFRGALNAGGTLYGSLTQSDQLSTTTFAETSRRQMSVVTGLGDARMAFQVLRDGSLVLTGRAIGQLNDVQSNITKAINGPVISGDVGAVADPMGNVHVYGRSISGELIEYVYTASTATWATRDLGLPPAGYLTTTPDPVLDPAHGVSILTTNDLGHLILFHEDGAAPQDLTTLGGGNAGRVYSTPSTILQNGVYYAYDTNQQGGLIEYQWPVNGGSVSFRAVNLGGGRETMLFQDVSVVASGTNRIVFGTDGTSRLVAVTITPTGDSAQNITELTKAGAVGYSSYQQPFAARVYDDVSADVSPNGDIYVYGTNARDLIEFFKPAGGNWQATDVTNALPANKVFGAPELYITPNGDRHILQINEEGEVVEYYKLVGQPWSTQNITLSDGNSASPPIFPTAIPAITILPEPGALPALVSTPAPIVAPTPPTPAHHKQVRVKVAQPPPPLNKAPKPKHVSHVHPIRHKPVAKAVIRRAHR
jgi:hypothetical protein